MEHEDVLLDVKAVDFVMEVLGMEKPVAMVSTDQMMARESNADIRCVDILQCRYFWFDATQGTSNAAHDHHVETME
eukprot:scaffold18802_cov83-Skeletonema_dohrnii-CCMP3373.AAC.4